MQTKTNRLLAGLITVIMLLSMLPIGAITAFAASSDSVRVIVENTTYTDDDAPWTGTLVDEWVDLKPDSTMMSCVVDALSAKGYSQRGAEYNYISEINGLGAFDGGSMSGWMGTLNDWFTNEGFGAFTVAGGTLSAGDEIRILYTTSYGADLGGSWGNTDKSLKALSFSAGTLSPEFDGSVHSYTLTVPSDVRDVIVTPTASNKNYQVRASVNGTEYKRTAAIPVEEGTVITVKCGDPAWPSMNGTVGEAQIYTVTVSREAAPPDDTEQVDLDKAAASDAVAKIDAIGKVTIFSADAIAAARAAYDALTADQQAYVANYDLLLEAEKAYAELIFENKEHEKIYQSVGDYIASLGTPAVGSVGGEWMVIGLARSGRAVPAGYYDAALKYVRENINDKEQLHRAKSTDNSRVILALTALGYDVTDVAGHNLLVGLTDMNYVKKQGVNGPIWALIAFDSHGYEIPEGNVTREGLIGEILDAQLPDGGWTLSTESADADMTSMALQALAPYYTENETVKSACDNALKCLSEIQLAGGGFGSWGSVNSESCAQVLTALAALGIDPQTDVRFIKNGCSVIDALAAFYAEVGFRHTVDGEINGMATEQGYYALSAYFRMLNGDTSLYDMSDVTVRTGENPAPSGGGTVKPGGSSSDQNGGDVHSPQTGDAAHIYAGIVMISLAGIAVISARKRRKI